MLGYFIVGGILTFVVIPSVFRAISRANHSQRRARSTGAIGESKVDRCLRKFKGKEFARAKDIMLPARGKTSQIDNILISRHGIFVIETKNYTGTVKGKEHHQNWTHIPPGRSKAGREFYNPIKQNEGHITALRHLMYKSFPNIPFHNIVVFSDDCRIPGIPGVVKMSSLQDALRQRMHGAPSLSETDVSAIKNIIESMNIKDKSERSQHITYAQSVADDAKQREADKARRAIDEANKDGALKVQNAYSTGLESLDSVISSAASKVVDAEQLPSEAQRETSR